MAPVARRRYAGNALKQANENNPFSTAVGKALHFMFLESKPKKPGLAGPMAVKLRSEEFRLDKKVSYYMHPKELAAQGW